MWTNVWCSEEMVIVCCRERNINFEKYPFFGAQNHQIFTTTTRITSPFWAPNLSILPAITNNNQISQPPLQSLTPPITCNSSLCTITPPPWPLGYSSLSPLSIHNHIIKQTCKLPFTQITHGCNSPTLCLSSLRRRQRSARPPSPKYHRASIAS